jgi:uncharacterized membrane protein YdjX (TVP38/TMEM64 family)
MDPLGYAGAMARRAPWVLLAVIAGLFLAGNAVRGQLGVEIGPEPLRDWVQSLGLVAPLIYVGMVTFRQFLLIPSVLLLTAGGLVFGAALGTLLGGFGIILSALIGFTLARTLGREWVRVRLGRRLGAIEKHTQRVGPLLIGIATAHPVGPMTAFHWGAGLASVAWLPFVAVVLVAGPARAFLLSSFGASLEEPQSPRFWATTIALAAAVLLPLAHPGLRQRLLPRASEARSEPQASEVHKA